MANRFAKGRPMAALVLSDDKRSYLGRQVRRQRVAHSLSEPCRIVLACAEGEQNKAGGGAGGRKSDCVIG